MPEQPEPKIRPHPFKGTGATARKGTGATARESSSAAVDAPLRRKAGERWHPDPPEYAELCVTSNCTFLTGASHPEEYVVQAASLGYRAAAVTDTHTVAGVVRAHVAAKEAVLRFVLGSRVRALDMPGCSVFLYPTDMASYGGLCRLLTVGKRRAPKGECHLRFDDVAAHAGGLLAIVAADDIVDEQFEGYVRRLREVFDDDRVSLAASVAYSADDAESLARLADLSSRAHVPLVATNDVHYHHPDRRMLHDVLSCVRHGCTLAEAGLRLHASAERYLKPPEEMHRLFAAHPAALSRTMEIVERTSAFTLDLLKYEYPDEVVPRGKTARQHLADLTWQGAAGRYPGGVPAKVRQQIKHELGLIEELSYASYFLTVHDLVRFARTGVGREASEPVAGWKGPILCQGRGAAANSAVCFCLGVTSVNPAEINLLFERFVSKERSEPPDIDIDFEHERREEVIQYIYRTYGRERAALTAEVITYRRRSAVRDVGKALGLSLDLVDRLAKSIDWFDRGLIDPARLREMGLNPADPTLRWLARLVGDVLGFPRHLSQHVGGFVITRSPLCELVPVENAAMPDRTVIEWDKDDIDAVGMLKVDVLGLGMLSVLGRGLLYVNRRDGGTKGRRDKVEEEDGKGQHVPGFARVATGQGTGEGDLPGDGEDAAVGAFRVDEPDAAGGGFHPLEHCRGLRTADFGGIPSVPAHVTRVAGRTVHAVRTGVRDDDAQRERRRDGAACGSGPHVASPHHEDRGTRASPELTPNSDHFVPLSLCPSVPLELHTIPWNDPSTYSMIQKADTIGVFQIESRAQMSMLPRLKPKEFYDLVIEVAIVRPGPIQGGMVHPYLRRRAGEEPIAPLPASVPPDIRAGIDEVLGRTLGVPLFQEQCMALAIKAAGFTAGEADQLRRAMAAWKRKGDLIYRFGRRLIDGMTERGLPREFAERCFEQIKGFSEYGFPESHAASFALLVYASAWLKRHYPAEFCAALLNSQPMGFYAPAQLIRDAREHGVTVLPVDVNRSEWECTMEEERDRGTEGQRDKVEEDGCHYPSPQPSHPAHELGAMGSAGKPCVRLGLRMVSGLGKPEGERIPSAVRERGAFRSMLALWRASGARAATMRRLAGADAFGSMGLSRQQALWQARLLRDERLPLFEEEGAGREAVGDGLDRLPAVTPLHQVVLDYDATGVSLRAHPVSFARERLRALGALPCAALRDPAATPDGEMVRVAGLVLVRQRPGTASGVTFMTIEDETGIANLVVWLRTYEKFRRAAASRMLVAAGRVQRAGEVVHVVVISLRGLDDAVGPLRVGSRDFH